MSCEDDQAECYELFDAIKSKDVLNPKEVERIDRMFDDFSEAYEADERVGDILDDIACTLKEHIADNDLTDLPIGWFVEAC